MLIAKIENDKVLQVADYRDMFANTSFPSSGISDKFLAENNCKKVLLFLSHDKVTEKLVSCEPYILSDFVYTIKVELKNAEELEADKEARSAEIRASRNRLLSDCDWTQLTDAPVDKQAWAIYRQALRDISNQTGFPWEVEFPKDPNYVEPVIEQNYLP